MNCRVCGSPNTQMAGEVEYYTGFAWPIYDCHQCGCRFSKHDDSIHAWLHNQPASSYGLYRELASQCKSLFDQGDLAGLRRQLSATPKYKFVIDAVSKLPKTSRLLEIGCSRGHLTSYFILAGYNVLGADVSAEAIAAAKDSFGDFFATADASVVTERAPYDVIYHVGTIGCVADPKALTNNLLNLLTPGGQLLFNAPNANSCWLNRQLWLDAAPPPDVVTLFRPEFWGRQFSAIAFVKEEIETCSSHDSFVIGLRKCFGRRWQKPVPLPLEESLLDFKQVRSAPNGVSRLWNHFERGTLAAARLARLSYLAPPQPSPFGLFITMTKR